MLFRSKDLQTLRGIPTSSRSCRGRSHRGNPLTVPILLVERLGVSAPADCRNGRGDHAAGADFSPGGIDRMETASLSNEANLDQAGEAQSQPPSSDTCDLEDLAIF